MGPKRDLEASEARRMEGARLLKRTVGRAEVPCAAWVCRGRP